MSKASPSAVPLPGGRGRPGAPSVAGRRHTLSRPTASSKEGAGGRRHELVADNMDPATPSLPLPVRGQPPRRNRRRPRARRPAALKRWRAAPRPSSRAGQQGAGGAVHRLFRTSTKVSPPFPVIEVRRPARGRSRDYDLAGGAHGAAADFAARSVGGVAAKHLRSAQPPRPPDLCARWAGYSPELIGQWRVAVTGPAHPERPPCAVGEPRRQVGGGRQTPASRWPAHRGGEGVDVGHRFGCASRAPDLPHLQVVDVGGAGEAPMAQPPGPAAPVARARRNRGVGFFAADDPGHARRPPLVIAGGPAGAQQFVAASPWLRSLRGHPGRATALARSRSTDRRSGSTPRLARWRRGRRRAFLEPPSEKKRCGIDRGQGPACAAAPPGPRLSPSAPIAAPAPRRLSSDRAAAGLRGRSELGNAPPTPLTGVAAPGPPSRPVRSASR